MALVDRIALASSSTRDAKRAADPTTLEEFGALLARGAGQSVRTKAGVSVGPKRALGITAWYSGVRYLSESVAGLPWHVYRKGPNDTRDRRASPPWLATPDVEMPWFGIIEFVMMSLLHKGNAYLWRIRNAAGQVVGLREIHPDRVTPGIAPDGSKRFLIDNDETLYSTFHVLHIPGLAYDGRMGLNPIQTFSDSLGTIAAADDFAGSWFGNNTHVGGIISIPEPLTLEQSKALKQEWDRFHEGLLNAHKTGVLSNGATYSRVTLSAADTQLLESRQYGVTEVARMLRIPPHKLYELTRSTNNNIEHQAIEAVTDGIQPWVQRIEAWFNFDPYMVPRGNYLEASLDGLLRGDVVARHGAYLSGIQAGWLSPATVARKENVPAPVELEYYQRPLNVAVIRPGMGEEVPQEVVPA